MKIEPTAALVMIWAREMYGTGSPGRFYSILDLSAEEKMKAFRDNGIAVAARPIEIAELIRDALA